MARRLEQEGDIHTTCQWVKDRHTTSCFSLDDVYLLGEVSDTAETLSDENNTADAAARGTADKAFLTEARGHKMDR